MNDALIIGSGPNGLAAGIRLAQAGLSVKIIEGAEQPGGGLRSAELTLPGLVHDVCAAIHPLSLASPFIKSLPLGEHGLEWVLPEVPFAHAFRPDDPVLIHQDLDEAANGLGADARAYTRLMRPFVDRWEALMEDFLGPLPLPPRHPILMTGFGLVSLPPVTWLTKLLFREPRTRAAFGGAAAHAMMPLEWPAVSGFGMMLSVLAHAVGWPMARGGSAQIASALTSLLESLGGEIETGRFVRSYDELSGAKHVLLDTTPKSVLGILGDRLHPGYARQLRRYRYGVGVCKVDWALSGPIPWAHPDYARAATVHIGGTIEDLADSERKIWHDEFSRTPFILLVQHSLFDESRVVDGRHTVWAYCHTPHGSSEDVILARRTRTAAEMEVYTPNSVGGDINGGVQNLRQFYTRPAIRLNPYRIPGDFDGRGVYICSSATPPGGGVHGMCGFHAAETLLRDIG